LSARETTGEAPRYRKAAASGGGDNCVEVARSADQVLVRHSKDPSGLTLSYTLDEWAAFLDGVSKGEFTPDALLQ